MREPGAPQPMLWRALGVGLIWLFLLIAAVASPAANHAGARGPAAHPLARASRRGYLALAPRLPPLSADPHLLRRRHRRGRSAHPRERPELFRRRLLPARALEVAAPRRGHGGRLLHHRHRRGLPPRALRLPRPWPLRLSHPHSHHLATPGGHP